MKTFLLTFVFAVALNAQDGNVEKGKKIFLTVGCYECHGTVGQGTVAGARIGPPVLPVVGFLRYVRRPGGAMPAFTDKVLTDQDLTDVYAYLKSVPGVKAVKDIPLLNDLKAK